MNHDSPPPGAGTKDRAQYRRVREAFDDLRVEDQAVFLAEAAVGVLARGVEQAGRAVADALDDLMRPRPQEPQSTATDPASGAPPRSGPIIDPTEPPPPPPAPEPPSSPDTR